MNHWTNIWILLYIQGEFYQKDWNLHKTVGFFAFVLTRFALYVYGKTEGNIRSAYLKLLGFKNDGNEGKDLVWFLDCDSFGFLCVFRGFFFCYLFVGDFLCFLTC